LPILFTADKSEDRQLAGCDIDLALINVAFLDFLTFWNVTRLTNDDKRRALTSGSSPSISATFVVPAMTNASGSKSAGGNT
jgi:hypothetical protein